MSSTTVAIELLSDRLDVAVLKGNHAMSSRRIPLDLPSDATSWAKAVRGTADKLKGAVTELGVLGAPASVVYRSPSQAADLASFELRAASQACSAARLSCVEALPYSANAAICEAVPIGRDRSGSKKRWHVVVSAERIDVARAIADLLEQAGLKFVSATPLDAAVMARMVAKALRYSGPQHGWLHFGEHSSFFILGGQGTIRFERSIALGLETVCKALSRPIRVPDESPVELDYETARTVLYEHGIPDTDEVVHDGFQLTRRHIMPQIQPVLQRYVVELRQSLRFGLSEEERSSISITMSGPGSSVPGIADLIGHELRLQVTADPDYTGFDYRSAASPGSELVEGMQDRRFLTRMNLRPKEILQRDQLRRMRRWLWSGAAAALVVVGADWFRYDEALKKAHQKESALATKADGLKNVQKTRDSLVAAVEAMNGLQATIAEEVGARADLHAIMHELSRLMPGTVRLTSIRLNREKDVMTARLYGRAVQPENSDHTELESFIEALKASPLFQDAVLKNVEVGLLADQPGQRFEASVNAILVPGIENLPAIAASGEDVDP